MPLTALGFTGISVLAVHWITENGQLDWYEGVQLISGFSPALLKLLMTGERLDTPFETFFKAVRDARYDVVEELALRAMEI